MSAKTLERTLGTKYRVTSTMLQRFRVAMVDAERKQLSGNIEVDETFIGGGQQGSKRGRGAIKSIVAIAVEIKETSCFGRVRMRHIPDAFGASLLPFVCDVTAPGSVIHSDGWSGTMGSLSLRVHSKSHCAIFFRRSCLCVHAAGCASCLKSVKALDSRHTARICSS